jgi:hypothetical protein
VDVSEAQLLGQVLSRDLAQGEQVDGAIDAFIEKRHAQRVKEEGERAEEEAWKESTRKHAAKQRQQARYEWHLHHTDQAERLRRTLEALIAHHEEQASKLGASLGGDAA